ncbi:MAG: S24/S26 family peptidase [Abditibacteriota bacterium]|nr:S24/S26 family peptidase [Abditibacteriota bacterium]
MSSLEELLRRDGVLVYKTRGASMAPMLREDRDLVIIAPPKEPPRKGDVILFRQGSLYVLHRIVGRQDGCFITRGDNNYTPETAPEEAVVGVLTGFKRKGREYGVRHPGYRLYAFLWTFFFPLRRSAFRAGRRLRRILQRSGLLPLAKKLLRKK